MPGLGCLDVSRVEDGGDGKFGDSSDDPWPTRERTFIRSCTNPRIRNLCGVHLGVCVIRESLCLRLVQPKACGSITTREDGRLPLPHGGYPDEVYGAEFGLHAELNNLPWDATIVEDSAERVAVNFKTKGVRMPVAVDMTLTLGRRVRRPSQLVEDGV